MRLALSLALLALLAGCLESVPEDPAGSPATSQDGLAADGAPDQQEPAMTADVDPREARYAADVSLAFGSCVSGSNMNACVLNVGDPRTGNSANIHHVPFAGAAVVLSGQATFTWTSQSPLNDRLEFRLALLDCQDGTCSTQEVLSQLEGTSPFTLDVGAVQVPEGATLGVSVTRGFVADGVRSSTFQDVHVEADLLVA